MRLQAWSDRILTWRPLSYWTVVGRGTLSTVAISAFIGLCGFAQRPVAAALQLPAAAPVVAHGTQRGDLPIRAESAHPTQAKFVVVLDAAHGGDDNGAQLPGNVAEKTVTLALSVRLRSLLTARGFQVVTTREGNVNMSPDVRAQIANHAAAAACLSLHAAQTGAGVHIFVSSLGPAQPSKFMAWKTAQAAYVTRSLKLASVLNSAFEHSSTGGTGAIPALMGRTALPGVDSMTCPAVAVEVAPLRGTDGQVVTEVSDPQYNSQTVETLAAALMEWRTDWESDARAGTKAAGGSTP